MNHINMYEWKQKLKSSRKNVSPRLLLGPVFPELKNKFIDIGLGLFTKC